MRGGQLDEVRELDPDGRMVVHHRLVDTLGRMLKSAPLMKACTMQRGTSRRPSTWRGWTRCGHCRSSRVPRMGRETELNERQLDARRRVNEAIQALGGISSPAGSCVWHVVGLQRSVREWALRQGWSGRSVDQKEAKGILVAALGMLARHYGYSDASRAS